MVSHNGVVARGLEKLKHFLSKNKVDQIRSVSSLSISLIINGLHRERNPLFDVVMKTLSKPILFGSTPKVRFLSGNWSYIITQKRNMVKCYGQKIESHCVAMQENQIRFIEDLIGFIWENLNFGTLPWSNPEKEINNGFACLMLVSSLWWLDAILDTCGKNNFSK